VFADFVAEGSFCQINVDMNMRETIMEKIESQTVDRTIFDDAEKHALNLLRYSVMPLWKSTTEFKNALKKLKITDLQELKAKRRASGVDVNGSKEDILLLEQSPNRE